jgi:hypothetical protein
MGRIVGAPPHLILIGELYFFRRGIQRKPQGEIVEVIVFHDATLTCPPGESLFFCAETTITTNYRTNLVIRFERLMIHPYVQGTPDPDRA